MKSQLVIRGLSADSEVYVNILAYSPKKLTGTGLGRRKSALQLKEVWYEPDVFKKGEGACDFEQPPALQFYVLSQSCDLSAKNSSIFSSSTNSSGFKELVDKMKSVHWSSLHSVCH